MRQAAATVHTVGTCEGSGNACAVLGRPGLALVRVCLSDFSVDRVFRLLDSLGSHVEIVFQPEPTSQRQAEPTLLFTRCDKTPRYPHTDHCCDGLGGGVHGILPQRFAVFTTCRAKVQGLTGRNCAAGFLRGALFVVCGGHFIGADVHTESLGPGDAAYVRVWRFSPGARVQAGRPGQ